MRLERTETMKELEHNKNSDSFIISELVAICREIDEFHTDDSELDSEIEELNKKIKKRQNVIKESERLEKEMRNKLNDVKENNFNIRTTLLAKLGSEL